MNVIMMLSSSVAVKGGVLHMGEAGEERAQ